MEATVAVGRQASFNSAFPFRPGKPGTATAAYPLADMENDMAQRVATRNIASVYDAASPQVKQTGREWYGRVHEATAQGADRLGLSTLQGAGMVAAVSPSMDWERGNIDAFRELGSLKQSDWNTIQESGEDRGRVESLLSGMGISKAPTSNLLKANRIMEGEDPNQVLTGPKTNAFMHNIAAPDRSGPVTIDGRAHDIAVNRLQPWESDRGINSSQLKTGKQTRYERLEDTYRSAADVADAGLLPHEMQAITWEAGKELETSGLTKAGTPRVRGVTRGGQGYSDLITKSRQLATRLQF